MLTNQNFIQGIKRNREKIYIPSLFQINTHDQVLAEICFDKYLTQKRQNTKSKSHFKVKNKISISSQGDLIPKDSTVYILFLQFYSHYSKYPEKFGAI